MTAFPDGSRCKTQGDCGAGILNAHRIAANAVSPLTPSTALLDYGAVSLDFVSTRDLTVSNTATGTTTVGTIGLGGDTSFTLASDACSGQTLSPSQSCVVQVSFSASVEGMASGTLGIPTSGGAQAALTTVALSGAVGSKLTSASTSLTLQDLVVGQNTSVAVSFENRYTQTERVALVTLTGDNAAVADDGCSNVELAPGASCDVTLTITPQSSGELSLSLSANTAGVGDVPFVVSIAARVAEPSSACSSEGEGGGEGGGDASTETPGSSGSGGGGCSVLRSGGLPDATLALLALLALTVSAYRKRKPGHAGSKLLAQQR